MELFPCVTAILLHSNAERPCAQILVAALLNQLLQPSGCADGKGAGFQHHAIPGCRVCRRVGADVIPDGPHDVSCACSKTKLFLSADSGIPQVQTQTCVCSLRLIALAACSLRVPQDSQHAPCTGKHAPVAVTDLV